MSLGTGRDGERVRFREECPVSGGVFSDFSVGKSILRILVSATLT